MFRHWLISTLLQENFSYPSWDEANSLTDAQLRTSAVCVNTNSVAPWGTLSPWSALPAKQVKQNWDFRISQDLVTTTDLILTSLRMALPSLVMTMPPIGSINIWKTKYESVGYCQPLNKVKKNKLKVTVNYTMLFVYCKPKHVLVTVNHILLFMLCKTKHSVVYCQPYLAAYAL